MEFWKSAWRERAYRILIIIGMLSPGFAYDRKAAGAGFAAAAVLGFLLGTAWILWTDRNGEKSRTPAQELGFYGALFLFMTGMAHQVAYLVAR